MIVMKAQDLAVLTGLGYRRIKQINDELPEDGKLLVKVEGGFDAERFVQAWVNYNVTKVRKNGELSLDDEKAMHEQLKREKTAIELERMRGELIPFETAKRVFGDVANMVMQRFLGLPTKIARTLIMVEDVEVIEAVLDKEVRETLALLADMPDIEGCDGMKENGDGESG